MSGSLANIDITGPVAIRTGQHTDSETIGMFFTGITPSIDMFNLPIFLFITPMFLFSGTFFPVSGLPAWAHTAALFFPLYHLVELSRFFCLGLVETSPLLSIAYLIGFTLCFLYLGLSAMRKRLVK